ncbi:serine hydrolase domain-containing protein [Ornithinicoccus halotolerans]|uniref:serine hydrolase domain-containing protein n=1 Tax=Ornithinicoccus halotolerans TaxID=1748220 RepID=UPI001E5761A2|nr:serine hydrolase domain-containing protein [Ornithinicoccus halotolerans]
MVVALLTVVTACQADAGDDGELAPDVVAELRAVVHDGGEGQVGGMAAWVDTPTADLALASGMANLAADEELTGEEAFRIASLTKLLTATVALQLVEEGRLALDDPIAEVLPEQADRFDHGGQITLRHLLGHTSGLPEYSDAPAYIQDRVRAASVDDGAPAAVVTAPCAGAERDGIGYAADQRQRFEPGTDFRYSNTNYLMVGRAIEAVTDRPLEDVYRARILEPLGMDDTWLACAERPRAELAHGYGDRDLLARDTGDPGQRLSQINAEVLDLTDYNKSFAWADGGLVSTGEDLAVFARTLFTGDLFDGPTTLTTMLEPGPHPLGPGTSYGLGVMLEDNVIGHSGMLPGYSSYIRYHPGTDTVVVAWRNSPPTRPGFAADMTSKELLDIVVDASR